MRDNIFWITVLSVRLEQLVKFARNLILRSLQGMDGLGVEGENLRNGEDDSYIFGLGIWVDGRPFAEMRKMGDNRFSKQVRCATPPGDKTSRNRTWKVG